MAHLEALAKKSRPAGGEAAAEARDYCAAHLRSLGFVVTERPFDYSALPGRFGAPIIGGVATVMVSAAAALGSTGRPMIAAQIAAITFIITWELGSWLGGIEGTRSRFFRRAAVNLEATRGDPRVWLVAHIDSKSQPVSTAVRSIGILLLGLSGVLAVMCGFLQVASLALWATVMALALAGGLPLVASTVGSSSHGAADNASGVAAVLEAAELVPRETALGVLVTDAEELALAGARAWVAGRDPATAINCDTVDDRGHLVVMRYGRGGPLAVRAEQAARAEDAWAKVIRPLPGVLTDSVAFRAAGWETVTLSRGTLRTLNRIHTKRDTLEAMRGTGIPGAARVLARLVEEMT